MTRDDRPRPAQGVGGLHDSTAAGSLSAALPPRRGGSSRTVVTVTARLPRLRLVTVVVTTGFGLGGAALGWSAAISLARVLRRCRPP